MQSRREVWKRLSSETKDFVLNYLERNLHIKKEEHETFLFPDYETNFLDPRAMHDMDRAVERILQAIKEEEKIAVYGDYDCDGVPGTALLRDFFEKINYSRVVYYIPHRHTEGYGLNKKAVDILNEQGVSLIITIDLGTTNIEEIDYATSLKIDTIVTDHHLPLETENGQILPKAFAIINNKKNSCNYSNKDLCGSGTIFKVVTCLTHTLQAIYSTRNSTEKNYFFLETNFEKKDFEKIGVRCPQVGYEKWLLDLVSIATISDMMQLTFENRNLVIYGLHVLSKTNRGGLQSLFQNAKVDLKKVSETDVAFAIAPRVNSASRMAHPKIALSMFSQNLEESISAAHELEELNNNRKETTKTITKKIYKILDERILNSSQKKLPEIVVIGESTWNAGVLGILATKILEKYNVNVFVFGGAEESVNNDTERPQIFFRGSCRSRGDLHLVKLMSAVKNNFLHFGGHELAGGFSITLENLHMLEEELNKNIEYARIENLVEQKKQLQQENIIKISIDKITSDFFDGLKLIGPFGLGNPKPIFQIENISDCRAERFGKNKEHLKLILSTSKNSTGKNLTSLEAIKFFVEEVEVEKILEQQKIGNIFYEIEAGWMSAKPRLKIIS